VSRTGLVNRLSPTLLRRIEKYPSRRKKRSGKSIKCYYTKKGLPKDSKPKLLRGDYYRAFRDERILLRILDNTKLITECPTKQERAITRRVYYCILPLLLSRLRDPFDLSIARDLEDYYYTSLNIMNYNRKVPRRVNRLNWELCHYNSTERISLLSKSSTEPMIRNELYVDSFGTTAFGKVHF
jgi:hypothetical protein